MGSLVKEQRAKATCGFKSWERGALLLARTGERSSWTLWVWRWPHTTRFIDCSSPEAGTEVRICVQAVYWGGALRKCQSEGRDEMQRRDGSHSRGCLSRLLVGVAGPPSLWGAPGDDEDLASELLVLQLPPSLADRCSQGCELPTIFGLPWAGTDQTQNPSGGMFWKVEGKKQWVQHWQCLLHSKILLNAFKIYDLIIYYFPASLVAQLLKKLPAMQEILVQSLGREDPLEKGTTTHSSIFAWKIPWTGDPGRLQSMGSQRVWHN